MASILHSGSNPETSHAPTTGACGESQVQNTTGLNVTKSRNPGMFLLCMVKKVDKERCT